MVLLPFPIDFDAENKFEVSRTIQLLRKRNPLYDTRILTPFLGAHK